MDFRRVDNLPPYVFAVIRDLTLELRRAGDDDCYHTELRGGGDERVGVVGVVVDGMVEATVEATVGDDTRMDLLRDVVAGLGLPLFRLSTRLTSLDEAFVRRSEELT